VLACEGASVFLLHMMTSKAFKKRHSLTTDVTGMHNKVCATELKIW